MQSEFMQIIPVLPSSDIARDMAWYGEKAGFTIHYSDNMYAVLYRGAITLHLQWHAGTADDPLLGGSVVRIQVNDIRSVFDEFLQRGTVRQGDLRMDTPWKTNEFGFYDLNRNAIFVAEDLE